MLQAINKGVVMVNFYDCYVGDCETQNVTIHDVVSKYIVYIAHRLSVCERLATRDVPLHIISLSFPVI